MFKRQFSRRNSSPKVSSKVSSGEIAKPVMDKLEGRVLFHSPAFTSAIADNKGECFLTIQDSSRTEIAPTSIGSAAIQMYTAGPDGHLGTTDDVKIHAALNYNSTNGRLTVRGAVPANVGYRVRVVGSRFKSVDNFQLDGEFNGANVLSGNGVEGGIYEFQVKNDRSSTPTVRMYTTAGAIAIQLRGDVAPVTVNNFLKYVNGSLYEGTAFHRSGRTESSPIQIIQGGGYQDSTLSAGTHISDFGQIVLEATGLTNVRGTIAMARTSVPNSATSEFFFNIQENAFLNPSGPGTGYAVFGTVTSGVDVTDTIYNAPTTVVGPFSNVPQVTSADVTIRRAAVVSRVQALPLP